MFFTFSNLKFFIVIIMKILIQFHPDIEKDQAGHIYWPVVEYSIVWSKGLPPACLKLKF